MEYICVLSATILVIRLIFTYCRIRANKKLDKVYREFKKDVESIYKNKIEEIAIKTMHH